MNDSQATISRDVESVYGLVSMRMIKLFVLLRRSGILAQRRMFGLSETEWRIMAQLGETAPLSLNGLAEGTLQDRGQISRAVKGMVERGILTRERKPGGPEIEIDLSDGGAALYRRMVEWVHQRDKALTAEVSEADNATVMRVLGTMIDRAQDILTEEQRLGGS